MSYPVTHHSYPNYFLQVRPRCLWWLVPARRVHTKLFASYYSVLRDVKESHALPDQSCAVLPLNITVPRFKCTFEPYTNHCKRYTTWTGTPPHTLTLTYLKLSAHINKTLLWKFNTNHQSTCTWVIQNDHCFFQNQY